MIQQNYVFFRNLPKSLRHDLIVLAVLTVRNAVIEIRPSDAKLQHFAVAVTNFYVKNVSVHSMKDIENKF
jgi:hypothetical protein